MRDFVLVFVFFFVVIVVLEFILYNAREGGGIAGLLSKSLPLSLLAVQSTQMPNHIMLSTVEGADCFGRNHTLFELH